MPKKTRIFFTSDVHGSDTCFRKFVNAGQHYKANVLILGGDITGKALVPIVKMNDGTYSYRNPDGQQIVKEADLKARETKLSGEGFYPYHLPDDQINEFNQSKDLRDSIFQELILDRVKKWIDLAAEKLANSEIKCFVQAGNDDYLKVDEVLNSSKRVINPTGKLVMIDEDHEMISTGYTNMTPWKCPRDIPDEALAEKIEGMVKTVANMKTCIFNFHCPPYDSGLDTAPSLDENLRPEFYGGSVLMKPVGSAAVRSAIEKHQPLLGLHGHVHESQGYARIGRTLCLNPGSEYAQELLRGYIVDLEGDKIKLYQPVQG